MDPEFFKLFADKVNTIQDAVNTLNLALQDNTKELVGVQQHQVFVDFVLGAVILGWLVQSVMVHYELKRTVDRLKVLEQATKQA
jgi:hypothetical protein